MGFVSQKIIVEMLQNSAKITAFLIVLHLAIVLPFALTVNIWIDEASTLYTTQNGFFYALQNAGANEKQAPLYFWILSLWRNLNDSIFWARIFSIACSCAAIYFFSNLARRIFDGKAAGFAAVFFTFHPYLIWASVEIRVYSLVILLSVLLLDFFERGFLKFDAPDENSILTKRARILFILTAIAALYTNYYLGFLLAGCFFALLTARKWREAQTYFLQMILAGAAFLPALWSIKQQLAANTGGFRAERTLVEGLQLLQGFFLTFILPTEIFPTGENASAVSVFRLWLVRLVILLIAVLVIKNRRGLNDKVLVFGTISGVIALFLLAAYFLLGAIYLEIRHAAVLFAPLILFGALILQSVFAQSGESKKKNNWRLVSAAILAIISVSFFVYSIYTLFPNLTRRGDWARVADFIEENEKPDQPIIVFPAFSALAPQIYYRGANRILPDEKFFDWEIEDVNETAGSLGKQTEFIISEIPAEASEIWLLTDDGCLTGAACEPLENFVQTNYTIVLEKDFYKEKVRLLRRK